MNKWGSSLLGLTTQARPPSYVSLYSLPLTFAKSFLSPIDRLHLDEIVPTVPSKWWIWFTNLLVAVGFNVETVNYKNLKFQVWDLGGQTGLRPYWRCYYQDTNAVIFVVDSADKDRIEIAKQELELMLQEEELKGVPVLILANK